MATKKFSMKATTNMNSLEGFLESSSIHGLYHIARQRGLERSDLPSRGPRLRCCWRQSAVSLWYKRAGVATLWATHFITIWNRESLIIWSGPVWERLVWMFIVTAGFSGTGLMICTAWAGWARSPVTTTIEVPQPELFAARDVKTLSYWV